MAETYVVQGAKMKCMFGSQDSTLQVPLDHKAFINGKAQANIMDFKPMMNVPSFGMCKSLANPTVAAATAANYGRLQEMPCMPVIVAPWMIGKIDALLGNFPSLTQSSTAICMWCGKISLQDSGQ